jgi:sulfur-oxidizing protein SoxA
MKKKITILSATLAAVTVGMMTVPLLSGPAYAFDDDAADWGKYQVEDRRSGYTYRSAETRALQDDEFENPGMVAVDNGEELWAIVDGDEGKSCESCHGDASESMAKVGATYPVFHEATGKPINVEQRINLCRTENMGAEPYKWEGGDMLAMTAFVKRQALDTPVSVSIDGPMAPFFEAGEKFYYERRGQLDMACSHCHEDNPGVMIRADHLSQGQINGFPTYRFKWQGLGSVHRRFRGCNKNIRATPFGYGADEYVNLELYLMWRGRGLPVETPAVRN